MLLLVETTFTARKCRKLGIQLPTKSMLTVFFMWQRHSISYIEELNQIRLDAYLHAIIPFQHFGIKMFRFTFKLMQCF